MGEDVQKRGMVFIIGAGPGDPGLLTLKAVQCLNDAEVVVYDSLVNRDILDHASKSAQLIYAGKRGGDHTLPQEKINALLIREARQGKIVARLKGGDPFLFSRGGEEAAELSRAGISFEIIPGVTSAFSVPAYAGIPLTHRGYASTVAVVTGHEDPVKVKSGVNWKAAAGMETLVVLMGVKNLPAVVAGLVDAGRDPATPAALIRWGTTPDQKTLVSTLGNIDNDAQRGGFESPSVLIVGQVVDLRGQMNWFEKKPLFGKGIVITRPREQAGVFARLLRAQGARVIFFPTIRIAPSRDLHRLDQAIGRMETYHWIIFTSVNGARLFFRRLQQQGKDSRDLRGIRICAIGPATAGAVEQQGIQVDLLPERFIGEDVVRAFRNKAMKGQRVLLPRAEVARDVIPRELTALGAEVEVVTVYQTLPSEMGKEILEGHIARGDVDVLTFTSTSTFTSFLGIMGPGFQLPPQVRIATIGPVTTAAVDRAGYHTDITADRYDVRGLVDALVLFFGKENHA